MKQISTRQLWNVYACLKSCPPQEHRKHRDCHVWSAQWSIPATLSPPALANIWREHSEAVLKRVLVVTEQRAQDAISKDQTGSSSCSNYRQEKIQPSFGTCRIPWVQKCVGTKRDEGKNDVCSTEINWLTVICGSVSNNPIGNFKWDSSFSLLVFKYRQPSNELIIF